MCPSVIKVDSLQDCYPKSYHSTYLNFKGCFSTLWIICIHCELCVLIHEGFCYWINHSCVLMYKEFIIWLKPVLYYGIFSKVSICSLNTYHKVKKCLKTTWIKITLFKTKTKGFALHRNLDAYTEYISCLCETVTDMFRILGKIRILTVFCNEEVWFKVIYGSISYLKC